MTQRKDPRGAKPKPPPVVVEVGMSREAYQQAGEAAVEVRRIELQQSQIETAERERRIADLAHKVGAARMAGLQAKFCAAAQIQLFEEFKEVNEIKDLPIPVGSGKCAAAQNFDEFCRLVFGRGYRAMQEESATLQALGEQAYEASQQLGLNRRHMRLIRALPAAQQEDIKAVLADASGSDVKALVQSLAEQAAQAKEQVAEAERKVAAKDAVIKAKDARNTDLLERLEIAEKGALPGGENDAKTMARLRDAVLTVEGAINALLAVAGATMESRGSEATQLAARQSVEYVAQLLVDGAEARGIAFDLTERLAPLPIEEFRKQIAATAEKGAPPTTNPGA